MYDDILKDVLTEAKTKNYSGYSKFDALNSPFLDKISFNNKWLRLLYTQIVKISPFHVRPILRVQPSRNPKGIALFIRSLLYLYEITKSKEYLYEAEILLKWLISNKSQNQKNFCWGYNFAWQNTIFFQDKNEPNAVVTVFVGEAFYHAYKITGNENYLKIIKSISRFFIKDLPVLYENDNERAIAYVRSKADAIVLNNQVLTGAFLLKVWKCTKDDELYDIALKQYNFTFLKKTNYDAWYYTYPKNKSPIKHDNYHTAGILDAFLDFKIYTDDNRFMDVYRNGLKYYKDNLFRNNGAPKWMNDKIFPHDVHGAASGIITFSKASSIDKGYKNQALKILEWTTKNLYDQKEKHYIYRIGRFFKYNYSLMRWCNAWMSCAISEFLYCEIKNDKKH